MENKQPLFSVTKKDFRIDYYRGTGKGGQKRNKTENCCRITHVESGAVGKSEEGRSRLHNQQTAFKRCVQTEIFQKWYKLEVARRLGKLADIEQEVERSMRPESLKVEMRDEEGRWIESAM